MSHSFSSLPCRALVPLFALSALACDAATLHVPGEYPTIQGAVDASRPEDTILVAPGTYVGSVLMEDKGGLTLESEAGAESTIIDGANDVHVVSIYGRNANDRSVTYRVAGFTIRNGRQGGIASVGVRTIIENNILKGNRTSNLELSWGAINMQENSGRVSNNWIEGNLTNGIEILQPHHVVVEGNHVEDNLGGIYVYGGPLAAPDIAARFVRNFVKGSQGWGTFFVRGPLHLEAADNLIIGDPDLANPTVGIGESITGRFINNTITGKTTQAPLVELWWQFEGFEFANNIVYSANDVPALHCSYVQGELSIHHNDAYSASGDSVVGDECVDAFAHGKGNVSVDPGFIEGGGGSRWQLAPDSALIDKGDNKVVEPLRRDIRGAPRIVDGGHAPVVDMGAFEYQPK